jgi:hypothetical protein
MTWKICKKWTPNKIGIPFQPAQNPVQVVDRIFSFATMLQPDQKISDRNSKLMPCKLRNWCAMRHEFKMASAKFSMFSSGIGKAKEMTDK